MSAPLSNHRWVRIAAGVELLVEPFSVELEERALPRLQRLVADFQRQLNAGGWRDLPDLTKPAAAAAFGVRLYCTACAQEAVLAWRGPCVPVLADHAAAGGALADLMSDDTVAATFLRRWRGATAANAVRREILTVVGLEDAR